MKYYQLQDDDYLDVIIGYDNISFYVYNYTLSIWEISNRKFQNFIEISEEKALGIIKQNNNMFDDQLKKAKEIAEQAHFNQFDRCGKPYIEHIYTVVNGVKDKEAKIVAYLHDVIEDTNITSEELTQKGIGKRMVSSVQRLTRSEATIEESKYIEYIKTIKIDPVAKEVKISDLHHNMDMKRTLNPTDNDYKRLEKYKKALSFLLEE